MLTGATIAPADALAAFAPMRQGYLSVPSNGDPVWDAAKMDFDGRIGPYEERLRSQLRSLLTELYVPALTAAGAADGRMQPAEVVREVSGLRHILSRKGVLSALEREVCGLLTGMSAFLSASTADLQQRIRDASSNPIDVLAATSQARGCPCYSVCLSPRMLWCVTSAPSVGDRIVSRFGRAHLGSSPRPALPVARR